MAVFSPVEPLLRACAHTQLEAAQFSIKTGNTTTFLPNKIEKKKSNIHKFTRRGVDV